jgi:HAD superfamily hydrolase (TIGR01490 family)
MAIDSVLAPRTVAAFDLDGTLTRHDTLVPFLMRVRGRNAVAGALTAAAPVLLRAAAGRATRQRAKEALLIRTLNGWWLDELRPVAEEYAHDVVEKELRPDRVARLRWHQEQGHDVLLVSASPELYVAAVGRLLGCTAVLASRLELDRRGRVTGRLFGDNVRGAEKERLLREWLGAAPARLWAYGDSDGDTEMLAMADVGVRLGGREKLSRAPAAGTAP